MDPDVGDVVQRLRAELKDINNLPGEGYLRLDGDPARLPDIILGIEIVLPDGNALLYERTAKKIDSDFLWNVIEDCRRRINVSSAINRAEQAASCNHYQPFSFDDFI